MIDFLSLSKSRLVTSRFPVASTTNVCPSVFTGNVNLRPVLSESGTASAKGMVTDIVAVVQYRVCKGTSGCKEPTPFDL